MMALMPAFAFFDPDQLAPRLLASSAPARLLKAFKGAVFRQRLSREAALSLLPEPLRGELSALAGRNSLTLQEKASADQGATVKFLLRTADGHAVESVLMDHRGRLTLCVSSQAGCAMGCVFCATARLGLKRNLSAVEILDQVEWALDELAPTGRRLRNLVFMGMGEPLLNYDEVARALTALTDRSRYNFSPRRITVSTCGLPAQIRRLGSDFPQVSLAVSLHAADQNLRSRLMPVAVSWPLDQLLPALADYQRETKNRLYLEYILMAGITDTPDLAQKLTALVAGLDVHVNLIPYNDEGDRAPDRETGGWRPLNSPWRPSSEAAVESFHQQLLQAGLASSVRRSKGETIAAACGQLVSRPVLLPTDH